MKNLIFLLFIPLLISCQSTPRKGVEVTGELKQWHKVTLVIPGPETSEWAEFNPFLNYRLEAEFSNGSRTYRVPGYFAADGNAGETSAKEGNIWKIHFKPDATGPWNYKISFKQGKNIAIAEGIGEPVPGDGMEGVIEISASDKSGTDLRGKGRIVNGGKGYFRFQDTQIIWIKKGTDSPENFLAYRDFDQTSRYSLKKIPEAEGKADPKAGLHLYEPHIGDWKEGDPTWQDGKGKAMIGALNYLSSAGVNSVYMLTLNIFGDGKDVWPYTDHNERYRFDCSKLDQWNIVFDHMESLGIMAHFVLAETENELLLDMGNTDVQRRIYLRELIARFGHNLAITWNLGEENGPSRKSDIGQTPQQIMDMASYIRAVNPYPCNVVLHTRPNDELQDSHLGPLLGHNYIDGPSLQIGNPFRVHERVLNWVDESERSGRPWLVNLDEIGPAWKGIMPDEYDPMHDTIRHHCLWGTLLAGGAGTEWYMGYRFPHNDLKCEDFRSRDNWWGQISLATEFVKGYPVEEMHSADELVKPAGSYCLANPGTVYVIYLPAGSKGSGLNLENEGSFEVKWFNPRSGGDLVSGTVKSISGDGFRDLGSPPQDLKKDWVAVIQNISKI